MIKQLDDWFPKNRIEALTDGIYAVALTILVLDLKLPVTGFGSEAFVYALQNQVPKLLTWALSFWVILIYWESQVRLNRLVGRIDSIFLRLDLIHLGLISLLPFTTSLIGEHSDQSLAVLIYTGNLWMISALYVVKIVVMHRRSELLCAEADVAKLIRPAKLMFGALTLALMLSYFIPGWNLLLILVPKLIPQK